MTQSVSSNRFPSMDILKQEETLQSDGGLDISNFALLYPIERGISSSQIYSNQCQIFSRFVPEGLVRLMTPDQVDEVIPKNLQTLEIWIHALLKNLPRKERNRELLQIIVQYGLEQDPSIEAQQKLAQEILRNNFSLYEIVKHESLRKPEIKIAGYAVKNMVQLWVEMSMKWDERVSHSMQSSSDAIPSIIISSLFKSENRARWQDHFLHFFHSQSAQMKSCNPQYSKPAEKLNEYKKIESSLKKIRKKIRIFIEALPSREEQSVEEQEVIDQLRRIFNRFKETYDLKKIEISCETVFYNFKFVKENFKNWLAIKFSKKKQVEELCRGLETKYNALMEKMTDSIRHRDYEKIGQQINEIYKSFEAIIDINNFEDKIDRISHLIVTCNDIEMRLFSFPLEGIEEDVKKIAISLHDLGIIFHQLQDLYSSHLENPISKRIKPLILKMQPAISAINQTYEPENQKLLIELCLLISRILSQRKNHDSLGKEIVDEINNLIGFMDVDETHMSGNQKILVEVCLLISAMLTQRLDSDALGEEISERVIPEIVKQINDFVQLPQEREDTKSVFRSLQRLINILYATYPQKTPYNEDEEEDFHKILRMTRDHLKHWVYDDKVLKLAQKRERVMRSINDLDSIDYMQKSFVESQENRYRKMLEITKRGLEQWVDSHKLIKLAVEKNAIQKLEKREKQKEQRIRQLSESTAMRDFFELYDEYKKKFSNVPSIEELETLIYSDTYWEVFACLSKEHEEYAFKAFKKIYELIEKKLSIEYLDYIEKVIIANQYSPKDPEWYVQQVSRIVEYAILKQSPSFVMNLEEEGKFPFCSWPKIQMLLDFLRPIESEKWLQTLHNISTEKIVRIVEEQDWSFFSCLENIPPNKLSPVWDETIKKLQNKIVDLNPAYLDVLEIQDPYFFIYETIKKIEPLFQIYPYNMHRNIPRLSMWNVTWENFMLRHRFLQAIEENNSQAQTILSETWKEAHATTFAVERKRFNLREKLYHQLRITDVCVDGVHDDVDQDFVLERIRDFGLEELPIAPTDVNSPDLVDQLRMHCIDAAIENNIPIEFLLRNERFRQWEQELWESLLTRIKKFYQKVPKLVELINSAEERMEPKIIVQHLFDMQEKMSRDLDNYKRYFEGQENGAYSALYFKEQENKYNYSTLSRFLKNMRFIVDAMQQCFDRDQNGNQMLLNSIAPFLSSKTTDEAYLFIYLTKTLNFSAFRSISLSTIASSEDIEDLVVSDSDIDAFDFFQQYHLPSLLALFDQLNELDLSGYLIDSLPEKFFPLENLQVLILNKTRLGSIQNVLEFIDRNCPKLRELQFNQNSILEIFQNDIKAIAKNTVLQLISIIGDRPYYIEGIDPQTSDKYEAIAHIIFSLIPNRSVMIQFMDGEEVKAEKAHIISERSILTVRLAAYS